MELRARAATGTEIDDRNRLTAPVWGNRLSLEQYLERERRLRATEFAKSSLRTWVLESDDGAIVASHESYAMRTESALGAGRAEGIASVFVEDRLRGKGYAAQLLSQSLARFREEKAQASILYSEVGAKIYSAIGYHARPIRARQWTPASGAVAEIATPFARGAGDEPDPARSIAGVPPRFRIALTSAQVDWQRERSSFYREVLAPDRRDPDTLAGAHAGAAWILWTPDYRLERLMVVAARPGAPGENATLVEALRRATSALGLPIAELWISPALDLPGGAEVPRDDEIPMIAPLAAGVAPEDWIDYGRGCWI